jgi:hypothetical protein
MMMSPPRAFTELLDEVDAAYRDLRKLVIDVLPVGEPTMSHALTAVQQRAADRFDVAEHNLDDYRAAEHDDRWWTRPASGG